MGKHAYLILCHDQWELLQILLKLLDDERNDIFIHVDKKSKFDPATVNVCKKSKVILTERIRVQWGGYSVVKATMNLLKIATENGHYDYYHLLSGHDLPLKSQDEIHKFFDEYQGKEFISLKPCDHMERVKYYYPMQDCLSELGVLGKIWKNTIRKISLAVQKVVGIDRVKGSEFTKWGIGSQFFDITDSFAMLLLDNSNLIYKTFHLGYCVDELFVQTIFLHFQFSRDICRFIQNPESKNQYFDSIFLDVNRAIDFYRGTPYVYKQGDFRSLVESKCLFARKFDLDTDRVIVKMIENKVLKGA